MTYDEAMEELAAHVADAETLATRAFLAATNEDGAPERELSVIRDKLRAIEGDIECLMRCRMTSAEYESARTLYDGAKLAGMV